MKLRLYLDTSVISAYFDDNVPERKIATHELWARKDEFELSTSALTRSELEQVADPKLKSLFIEMLEVITTHPLTSEIEDIAEHYIVSNIFTKTMFNDALHVAAAVLTRNNVLVSWNFRHLVNRRRRAQINLVNSSLDLPTIEIIPRGLLALHWVVLPQDIVVSQSCKYNR